MLPLKLTLDSGEDPFAGASAGVRSLIGPLANLLMVMLGIFAAATLVAVVLKVLRGEREGIERMFVWFVGAVLGFVMIYVLRSVLGV